jgi:uncharacterized repeat protein (TIGR01451 family)
MQSAIWKAVALTGVIGIGCYVVYEVHRRLPTTQTGEPTAQQFKHLEGESVEANGAATSTAGVGPQSEPGDQPDVGDSAAFDPFAGGWDREAPVNTDSQGPPAQDEPQVAVSPGSGEQPQSDADSPWSRQEQRSAALDTRLDAPFNPRAMPAVAHGAEGMDAAQELFGAGDRQPIMSSESPTFAEEDSSVGDSASIEADSAVGDSRTDSGISTVSGAASPSAASLAEFTGDHTAASDSPSADTASDAADLFGPGLESGVESPAPALLPAGDAAFAADGFGDALPESGADVYPAHDPPSMPPAAAADPFSPFGDTGDSAESTGAGDAAPAADSSQDAAGSAAVIDTAEPSQAPLGLVLPLDEPAEFPLGQGTAEPAALPAQVDASPFVIEPARERTLPSSAATASPAVQPRRDFVGDGTIGDQTRPGPQQPELKVEKVAPPEATVGEPLVYAIRVTNTGRSAAHDVVVEDRIPRGTTLDGTIPRAELADKRLTWRLGTIEPGGEQMIRIRVIPNEAGEIGSIATVRFVAEVAAATVITRPELALEMSGPPETAVGEQAVFHFVVTNRGSGDARDVVIRSLLPPGLEHPDGEDIEYPLGRIRAGEAREIDLVVTAGQPGQLRGQGLVTIGSKTYAQEEAPVTVIPSRLLIRREGPARRFVNSKAEYVTTVTNRSSRDLQQITVEEQLPPGLELASMPEGAQFDRQRRTVTWRFPLLRAGESSVVRTSVVGQSPGSMEVVMRAGDAAGNKAVLASKLEVAGVSSLAVDFSHDGRPVAVGQKVALKMTVTNRGTASAQGVQALFEIPENMEFVTADGPVDYEQEGRIVRFAAVDEIKASGKQTFDIVLTAAESGTQRVTAQLMAPNLSEPLRNDEAVVVEGDE